ncbi:hypothetical protein SEETMRM10961_15940 [Salmonella enterica subsp. enterica serovar Typhimurium]|nr:hypothetical protein SEETMRM10961_15940 [Salmonella enterica subsp. enterica serovar Typhimurium]
MQELHVRLVSAFETG